MPPSPVSVAYVPAHCQRANRLFNAAPACCRVPLTRRVATSAPRSETESDNGRDDASQSAKEKPDGDDGAMTRRLRALSDEALESGGRASHKTVSEAGFSEDLRKQLEERIASANFRAEHRNAFVEANLPSHAGRGSRDMAIAQPWLGEESIHDASLRMLTDAHKPLRSGRGAGLPGPSAQLPKSVDTGRKSVSARGAGTRLANARDRSGLYSSLKDSDLDDKEREKRFQELKDRFSPHARSVVPGTIQGLASLANERIENAIARGQFKNIPRGKGKQVERDYNASNPFLDTTEYFLNKMIQKQEIVPPWIEKQQELVSTATKFRARLRNDWKRHAARMIASKGGGLQDQIRRAEAYAKAELIVNPRKKKTETLNTVDEDGQISQISLSGELKIPVSQPSDGQQTIIEQVVAEKVAMIDENLGTDVVSEGQTSDVISGASANAQAIEVPVEAPSAVVPPATHAFRDEQWLKTEHAFHSLSIADLNSKTRSYNLQAPDLAKKPYFSLERELNACYADVAPQLAEAIRERATRPRAKVLGLGESMAGGGRSRVMDRLVGEKVKVRDERVERRYGFRQFWKDVWGER